MRQVILDTETTGLQVKQGHRIIEIGCTEIINRRKTGESYHCYINPKRDIDEGAMSVHGISEEMLKDEPLFADIAQPFVEFIRDSEVIIHNASFDVGFIDQEFKLLGKKWGKLEDYCLILDSLDIAKKLHPGQKNSLDDLCKRYGIDNANRVLHGALLDAELLADVYLSMTGGQDTLGFGETEQHIQQKAVVNDAKQHVRGSLYLQKPNELEYKEHLKYLEMIQEKSNGKCLWIE